MAQIQDHFEDNISKLQTVIHEIQTKIMLLHNQIQSCLVTYPANFKEIERKEIEIRSLREQLTELKSQLRELKEQKQNPQFSFTPPQMIFEEP